MIFKLGGIGRDVFPFVEEAYHKVIYAVVDYVKDLEVADPGHLKKGR